MKKLLLLSLLYSATCCAQSDSLSERVKTLEMKMQVLEYRMSDFSHLYKSGLVITGLGLAANLISINATERLKDPLQWVGGAAGIIGVGIMVVSHLQIAKCRNLSVSPGGIAYKF